jgi:sorbose reductase
MGILERFSLEGRTALVTGGGTGIGKGFAIALAEAGADVAVSGRTAATIEAVAAEVEALGRKSLAIVADVRVKAEVDAMVDAVVDAWGKLDIGVNNAGVCTHVSVDEMGEEEWDRVIDTNLKGPYLCSLAQARVMRPNSYGKIINNASISGHIVNRPQDQTHYNTSKAGLIHLTKSLAAEWAADGIYVNSISPGYIRTDMADTPAIAKMHPIWLRDTPVGRLGEVEDLQGALIFLASENSNFVTGCDLIVDGGFTIW